MTKSLFLPPLSVLIALLQILRDELSHDSIEFKCVCRFLQVCQYIHYTTFQNGQYKPYLYFDKRFGTSVDVVEKSKNDKNKIELKGLTKKQEIDVRRLVLDASDYATGLFPIEMKAKYSKIEENNKTLHNIFENK